MLLSRRSLLIVAVAPLLLAFSGSASSAATDVQQNSAGAARPSDRSSSPPIKVVAVGRPERFCGDADLAVLTLALKICAVNESRQTVILSRRPGVRQPLVAASAEMGREGHLEGWWDTDDRLAGERPPFGPQPDPREFVLLRPGQRFETKLSVSVFVRSRDQKPEPTTVVEDSRHVLSAPIDWGSPFVALSTAEMDELTARWRASGVLYAEESFTPWIPFSVPKMSDRTQCPEPAQ